MNEKLDRLVLTISGQRQFAENWFRNNTMQDSWADLKFIKSVTNISEILRTEMQKEALEIYKRKYPKDKKFHSQMYILVSPELQKNYDFIYGQISKCLYSDSEE